MEYRERREPLGLSDLLLVYHDFLLALSRRTERLIQDFNAFIQCFIGRWMAAGCHNLAASVKRLRYEKTRRGGSSEIVFVVVHRSLEDHFCIFKAGRFKSLSYGLSQASRIAFIVISSAFPV